jgi:hypothetical protein
MSLTMLEQNARRAKEANSFSDYKPGSATTEYQEYCKAADETAQKAKERLAKTGAPAERAEKVDYLLKLYKSKKLEWLSEMYSVRARVPSVMIAGPSNFPVRAKQKQLAREKSLNEQDPDYILEEIRGIGHNAKTIYSDDKNAVERIKAKIAALEVAPPDRWGYNKTEIRRLKERLLQLAPEEFAEHQANITVNGAKTYEEIVALWESGKIHQSRYDATNGLWYFDLLLDFTDGKRHYREMVSIEVDETGENRVTFNLEKRETELIPLTAEHKYSLIIGRISGSGNKAVIYQHLKNLTPKMQAAKAVEESSNSETTDTVTINGETAKVVRNKEDMRLQLMFDGKPDEKTRETLKSNGFRWAPSNMAWQRLLNENAEWALRRIAKA